MQTWPKVHSIEPRKVSLRGLVAPSSASNTWNCRGCFSSKKYSRARTREKTGLEQERSTSVRSTCSRKGWGFLGMEVTFPCPGLLRSCQLSLGHHILSNKLFFSWVDP